VERLADYTLGLFASATYLAAHGVPSSMADLAHHTVIFYIDSMLQVGDLDLGRFLPGITARFASTSVFAQVEATVAGAGIGLLPHFLARRSPGLRELDGLGVRAQLSYTLAARRDGATRAAVQVLRQAFRDEVHRRRDELVPPNVRHAAASRSAPSSAM
jgi:DNA-binding transcriptional LysR family regulator